MKRTDEELLGDFAMGVDDIAFTILYARHVKSLTKTICRDYTRDWATAEDIVQDVFTWVIENYGEFDPVYLLRPWLCALCIRHAIELGYPRPMTNLAMAA